MGATNDLLAQFTAFRVDGEHYPGGPMTWSFDRWVGGMFSADATTLAQRMPVEHLHPLRWRPGRALLVVEGAEVHQQRTGVPPTGGAFIALSVLVTYGPGPAPALLPLLGDPMGQRYQVGVLPLRFLMTNSVEAQLFAGQFGFDMRIADIERRTHEGIEEFACWVEGRPVARLQVRTKGVVRPALPNLTFYSVRDGQPFRMSMSNPDPGAIRVGPGAATLALTDAGPVADLRALRISSRSWMGVSKAGSHWYARTPPELLGSAHTPAGPPAAAVRAGRFTRRLGQQQAEVIDPGFDALPFDPDGTIEVPALPAAGSSRGPGEEAARSNAGR